MCGRYVIISQAKEIEEKFNVKVNITIPKNFNVTAGQFAPVITSEKSEEVQLMTFGFTPKWSKKRTYVLNARAEGDHNKENIANYNGAKGIISKPFFRSSIRNKRCLVIADAFIEGTIKEKLEKPFLVYLKDKKRPFAFAGIHDEWLDINSGELINSFAIITCPPNKLMQKIPHHRMPVILNPQDYSTYLSRETELSDITSLLSSYDAEEMNAYPIDPIIKKVATNNKEALQPIGDTLFRESTFQKSEEVKLFGMGESPARNRRNPST